LKPTGVSSWRGDYAELAIEFNDKGEPMLLTEFIALLENAIGKSFEGWKGGNFMMERNTRLWVANPGHSGSTGIIGVREDHRTVNLLTSHFDY
jgi:hypothetical protein